MSFIKAVIAFQAYLRFNELNVVRTTRMLVFINCHCDVWLRWFFFFFFSLGGGGGGGGGGGRIRDQMLRHWDPMRTQQLITAMSTMAYQITGVSIVYSAVCSGANHRKHKSSTALALWGEYNQNLTLIFGPHSIAKSIIWELTASNSPVTDEFPAERASNEENIPIWWPHHAFRMAEYKVL